MFDLKAGSHTRMHWLLALAGMLALCGNLRAQLLSLSFSVSNSPSPSAIDVPLTNIITVTNLNSPLTPPMDVFITNEWSGPVYLSSYAPPGDGTAVETNSATRIVFEISLFQSSTIEQMYVTLQPTNSGFVTNTVTVSAPSAAGTNFSVRTVVNEITNVTTDADLAVALSGPRQAVITNDWMTYQVLITNLGPATASGVMLTNSLPAGVALRGVAPAGQQYSLRGTNLVFSLGTLAKGAFRNLKLTVQPTNAGTLPFTATVGASGVPDTNSNNNTASTNIVVGGYLRGQLAVELVDPTQHLDLQNGLMEQTVRLTNEGTNTVDSARLVVAGLTKTNWLVNAWGTNNVSPFVNLATPLDPDQSADLLLQFLATARSPFLLTTNQLHAFAIPLVNLAPPPGLGSPVAGLRIRRLVSGRVLIQFPSRTNRTYSVVYYDNLSSNGCLAFPAGTASANWSQWIDYGPPETTRSPSNSVMRFYRVFLNP